MKILAIETSCDDTCGAVLQGNGQSNILSHKSSSQVEIHEEWGGVYPTMAKREHQNNLVPILKNTLDEAGLLEKGNSYNSNIQEVLDQESKLLKGLTSFLKTYKKPEIDLLAVTVGPGLDPCLWMGINFIKALAASWNLKVIPVNHIKAHFFTSLALNNPDFPTISLVASGGHTQLILSTSFDDHQILGKTRDDAAGECFDKTARILGMKYPGGPKIAQLAKKETGRSVSLPRPMIDTDNYDFSFAGLKTAVLYDYQDCAETDENYKIAMAKEIQESITDVLTEKTFRAAQEKKAKSVVLGGGVSANQKLRNKFKKKADQNNINLLLPEKEFSTDNAKMIAITSYYKAQKDKQTNWKNLKSKPNLKIN